MSLPKPHKPVSLHALRERLAALDAKPCHETRLLRLWLQGLPLDTPGVRPQHKFPLAMQREMPALINFFAGLALSHSQHLGEDGSMRMLLALDDGQTVETVLLPRDGVCISTQVGCAVGCVFCMTGRSGLIRQLGSLEILAQLAEARRQRSIRKIVFMGMGEPAHNLDEVLEAIGLMGTLGGIAHKNLVFSTVGDRRVFARLPLERVKPALALSLHTTLAGKREQLLPQAARLSPDELVALAEAYARLSGYPVQYQWTLIEGLNDSDEEVEGLVRLLTGKYAVLNLIPFNSIEGSVFKRPSWEHVAAMARTLHQRGILTKVRRSSGQDVDAGCGQLRRRVLDEAGAIAGDTMAPKTVLFSRATLRPQ